MKIIFPSTLVSLLFVSTLAMSAPPSEDVQQLTRKFQSKIRAVSTEYSAALIKYLKRKPTPEDFVDGLRALTSLEIAEADIAGLRDIIQRRSAQLEAQLTDEKNPAKKLAHINELLVLGDYLNMEPNARVTLLQKKYDLVINLQDQDERTDAALGEDGVIKALISHYEEARQKKQGLTFLKRVKQDFPKIDAEALANLEKEFSVMDAVGEPFSLSFKSINGEKIDLAQLHGKVVLIDFWATWCGPCMKSMPEMVALYDKFHPQGLDIIGISLDKDRDALDKVLHSRKISWPQFFDGKGWQNEIARAHGVSAIPASFLVDQNAKLAAVDLRGPELEQKIGELLKKLH